MSLVKNNLEIMSNSDTLGVPMGKADKFKVRFNLELLKGCEFQCSGCYVNRDNSFNQKELDIVLDAAIKFKKEDYHFDEIIIGPTDFFSAKNTVELIQNQSFKSLFTKDVVLTLLSTLQTDTAEILSRIDLMNTHLPNLELEVLIPVEIEKLVNKDLLYIGSLKEKIKLLNHFSGDVEYALQLNIQNTKCYPGFNLKSLMQFVESEFNSITEFNPSFMRLANKEKIQTTILSWNNMLSENKEIFLKEDMLFTMGNPNHASFNEITFNYQRGKFYSCPFIYENVFDKAEAFLISSTGEDGYYDVKDFENHRGFIESRQLSYIDKTEDCKSCSFLASCMGKQVLHFMEEKSITKCLLAKDLMDTYA
jgi:radical SAM protein with 4Fe4S-binding SPASM domain